MSRTMGGLGRGIAMYEHLDVVITLVVLCVAAFVWQFVYGKNGLRARKLKSQVRELEVQIRLASGPQVAEHLRSIANLYLGAGDPYSADQYYEKAVKALEREMGTLNPQLIPLLSEHLKLVERMKRKKDAAKIKQRIKDLKDRQAKA